MADHLLPTTTAPSQRQPSLIGLGRDLSPDSVIIAPHESNFSSLFSSNSASAERCSFASADTVLDHDSLLSKITQQLAGHEGGEEEEEEEDDDDDLAGDGGNLNAPDPVYRPPPPPLPSDSNKSGLAVPLHSSSSIHSGFIRGKVDRAKGQGEEDNRFLHLDGDLQFIDSARNSFSLALKECQERRSRSDAIRKKSERRRPASMDLNNIVFSNAVSVSPRFGGVVRKGNSAVSSRKSGNFPSPGTPCYRHATVGTNKGWSSERVRSSSNANRRQAGGAALMPFNSVRTLPSKWEDAERWIFSPVAGEGVIRTSYQHLHRRPKSKSGPLGAPGIAYYSVYSPAVPMYYDANHVNRSVAPSPFYAGMVQADGLSIGGGVRDGGAYSNRAEPCIGRSASVHGCTDLICLSAAAASQDEKPNDLKDTAADISRVVSKRDMATQMSPARSSHSSPPRRRLSFSTAAPSALPIVEAQNFSSSKAEVRDVQVDERVTVTRWSKKHKSRIPGRASDDVDDWKLKMIECHSSSCDVSDTAKSISKEEERITAWENLQKAKAEAEIRKLEMKLEKKRSSSIDKIMNKFRSAQKKAEVMRNGVLASQAPQASQVSHKNGAAISSRRANQMSSLSGCFACHAF